MWESRVDTDGDGLPDLVKVSIIRPRYQGQVPAVGDRFSQGNQ